MPGRFLFVCGVISASMLFNCTAFANWTSTQIDPNQPDAFNVAGFENAHYCEMGHYIPERPCRVLIITVGLRHTSQSNPHLSLSYAPRWTVPGYEPQYSDYVVHYHHVPGQVNMFLYALVNPRTGSGTISTQTNAAGTYLVSMMATNYWNAKQQKPNTGVVSTQGWGAHEVLRYDQSQWVSGMAPGSLLPFMVMAIATDRWWRTNCAVSPTYLETKLFDWRVRNATFAGGYAPIDSTGSWPLGLHWGVSSVDKLLVAAGVEPVVTPVIYLNGANPYPLQCGQPYSEPGWYAHDGYNNDISGYCVNVSGAPNVDVPGDYTIAYSVSCGSGATAYRTVQVRDTTPPVVTITNPPSKQITAECMVPYDMSAVTVAASDSCDSVVGPGSIVTNWGGFNPWVPQVGTYNVVYSATDAYGNTGSDTLVVTVQDTIKPAISVNPETVYVECGGYTGAMALEGVSCWDSCGGELTNILVSGASFPITSFGTYTLYYNKSDNSGNPADQKMRTVIVQDTQAPVIIDNGNATPVVECPNVYTMANALAFIDATDNCLGNVKSRMTVEAFITPENTPAAFPLSEVGAYAIYYNVTDDAGNAAEEIVRLLTIQDTTPPVWAPKPDIAITNVQMPFTEADALEGTAVMDACATSLVISVQTQNFHNGTPIPFPIEDPGVPYPRIYKLVYTADDGYGNIAVDNTRTLIVMSEFELGITIIGDNPITVGCRSPYTAAEDPGAVAFDPIFGDQTQFMTATGLPVNTAVLGPHLVTYSVSIQGVSYQKQRLVIVEDNDTPEITLVRGSYVRIGQGAAYTDPGAIALDPCEGNISPLIVVSGDTVDTSAPVGTLYNVHYNVSDSTGNSAAQRTRTIELVIDEDPPVISLVGGDASVGCGEGFTELGYSAYDEVEGYITESVLVTGEPITPMTPPGVYLFTYNVADQMGNQAEERTRWVTVREDCPLRVDYVGEVDVQGIMRKTVTARDSYTFAVEIHGAIGDVNYVWKHTPWKSNYKTVKDAPNQPVFTLENITLEDAGQYVCEVSDAVWVAQSPEFTLVVEAGLPAQNPMTLAALSALMAVIGALLLCRRARQAVPSQGR